MVMRLIANATPNSLSPRAQLEWDREVRRLSGEATGDAVVEPLPAERGQETAGDHDDGIEEGDPPGVHVDHEERVRPVDFADRVQDDHDDRVDPGVLDGEERVAEREAGRALEEDEGHERDDGSHRGRLVRRYFIPGELHTVRPVSERYRVYARNARSVSILDTDHFGPLLTVEVGAMLVGHIVEHPLPNITFDALQEKGYFEFGGSTVLLVTGPNVTIDTDLLEASARGDEVKVRLGEPVGRKGKAS